MSVLALCRTLKRRWVTCLATAWWRRPSCPTWGPSSPTIVTRWCRKSGWLRWGPEAGILHLLRAHQLLFFYFIYFLLLLLLNGEGGRDGKHGIVDIVISHSGKNKIFCILHEAAGQASLCFNCPKMYVHAGSQTGGALRTRLRFLWLHGQAHSGAGLEHPGVAQWWLLHREWCHRHSRVPVAADGGPTRSGHQVDQEHGGDKG